MADILTMLLVVADGVDPIGEVRRFGFGGLGLADSFEVINGLARLGTVLTRIELIDDKSTPVLLLVEAFDGKPLAPHIQSLQAQWQKLLG